MKEINNNLVDASARISNEHIWVRPEGDSALVGISDYAQDQLGEIVFVELPEPGEHLDQNAVFGMVESVKTSSELYMPVSGNVVTINETLEENPELVNSAPFAEGWMVRIEPDDRNDIEILMSAKVYQEMLSI